MTDFVLVYLILIIGACLQSVIGFGLGMLCVPVLYWLMPELVPGPMILNALFLTSVLMIKHRGAIDMKQTGISIIGGAVGVILAAVVMWYVNAKQYQLLLGVSILIVVALSIIGMKPKISTITSLLASMSSGFLGTTTSAGGAPMGLLYQAEDKDKIKANLSAFFVFINLFGIIVLMLTGSADMADVKLFFFCLPAILIGWGLSFVVNNNLNEKAIRGIILLVAGLSGLALIFIHR
ncbi:sulfite exporter TauE/SafE family protein [Pseudoalteromonas sp. Cn5-37]|uniref:sulfite exporter TauE/SafE family protein n=1 Tax=Pseudoalteromonas sp. Cn5-37 TaxID=2908886 RepID=UPI001F1E6687|nr:sulfite exporter TauE/SafE family protein [Pseudoalteromonas sp. Cn5-37]MCF2917265.1 sulfite exporter TauE/SafE family protein [Pseudoalteromonas sp. Cn5-37]